MLPSAWQTSIDCVDTYHWPWTEKIKETGTMGKRNAPVTGHTRQAQDRQGWRAADLQRDRCPASIPRTHQDPVGLLVSPSSAWLVATSSTLMAMPGS